MEKRIELEKRGRNASQITDLNLDNCRANQICGLTEEFVNLKILSLINVGLMSLKGFPALPNLERLELSDNRIQSGLNLLSGSPKLANLNLCGNKIKDLQTLEPLKDFKHLQSLDLFNCEITNIPNYRNEVFKLLPSLKWLDGYDKNGKELPDTDDDEDDENEVDDDEEEEDDEEDGAGDVDEEGDEDEDEDESDDEVGLSYLQGEDVDEEESGDEFNPNPQELENSGDEEIDDDADEDEADSSVVSAAGSSNKNDVKADAGDEEKSASRGQKRKREDDGDDDGV